VWVKKRLNESMSFQILGERAVYMDSNTRPCTQQCAACSISIMEVPCRGRFFLAVFTSVCANPGPAPCGRLRVEHSFVAGRFPTPLLIGGCKLQEALRRVVRYDPLMIGVQVRKKFASRAIEARRRD
jgi:hypothetical protein